VQAFDKNTGWNWHLEQLAIKWSFSRLSKIPHFIGPLLFFPRFSSRQILEVQIKTRTTKCAAVILQQFKPILVLF